MGGKKSYFIADAPEHSDKKTSSNHGYNTNLPLTSAGKIRQYELIFDC